jgi:hypothetical protein
LSRGSSASTARFPEIVTTVSPPKCQWKKLPENVIAAFRHEIQALRKLLEKAEKWCKREN